MTKLQYATSTSNIQANLQVELTPLNALHDYHYLSDPSVEYLLYKTFALIR